MTVATRGLAAEYAGDKIRFNCIRPAVGETAMLAKVIGGTDTPEGRKKVLGTIPLGRVVRWRLHDPGIRSRVSLHVIAMIADVL